MTCWQKSYLTRFMTLLEQPSMKWWMSEYHVFFIMISYRDFTSHHIILGKFHGHVKILKLPTAGWLSVLLAIFLWPLCIYPSFLSKERKKSNTKHVYERHKWCNHTCITFLLISWKYRDNSVVSLSHVCQYLEQVTHLFRGTPLYCFSLNIVFF